MSRQTITARVDADIVKIAKELAKKNGISLSSIINLKLREFVDNRELKLIDDTFDIDFGPDGVDAKDVLDFLEKSNK